MKHARRIALALGILLPLIASCQALQAWKGELGYNQKTGQATGTLKGSTGSYNENTGLNFVTGDNSIVAIAIILGVVVIIYSAYPLQRAIRLHRERKWYDRLAQLQNGSAGLSSGLPSGLPSPMAYDTSKGGYPR